MLNKLKNIFLPLQMQQKEINALKEDNKTYKEIYFEKMEQIAALKEANKRKCDDIFLLEEENNYLRKGIFHFKVIAIIFFIVAVFETIINITH